MLLRRDTISYYLPSVQWAAYWITRRAGAHRNHIHVIRLDLSCLVLFKGFQMAAGSGETASLRTNQQDVTSIPQLSEQVSASAYITLLAEWEKV